jgi:hypothetical protein
MIKKQTSNNIAEIVKSGAKTGALIGLFAWICILGFFIGANILINKENLYLYKYLSFSINELKRMLSYMTSYNLHLTRFSHIIFLILPVLPLILAVLGASLSYLAHKIKPSPEVLGWSSLKWAFRSFFTWPGIALSLAVQALIIVATIFVSVNNQLWMKIALATLAFCVSSVVPLIVCNIDTASIPISRSWWKPKWPGRKVVGVFLLLNALNLILLKNNFVTYFIITLFQTSILLSRSTRISTISKKIFHRQIIGPWIAYYLFSTLTFTIIFLYFFSPRCFIIFGAPSIFMLYGGQGLPHHLISRLSFFAKNYFYTFSVPVMAVYWMGATRLGWKIGLHKLS